MKYEQYRLRKWRERVKFGIQDYSKVDELLEELRLAFGHLCTDCKGGRFCPYREGGRVVMLQCPHYEQREIRVGDRR